MTEDQREIVFLPLGGAGEIGMNLNLYGFGPPGRQDWLMIDLGITFGSNGVPGVDIVMADPAFIAERRDRLLGLLLTHAHEDHLGAIPYLWRQLGCPVYGTPFALAMLRRKLDEAGLAGSVPLRLFPPDGRLQLGPFAIEVVGVTHSIPEAQAVALRTPLGTVVHTGDWKFDPDPVVGDTADEAALGRLGDEGVLAVVCDSTNVFEPGSSGSEATLIGELTRLVAGCSGRVVIVCFASNVARLETIGRVARATGRDVVMTGRSLKRTYEVAREVGYLADLPSFVDDTLGGYLPKDKTLIVATGGQGEPNAALARLASGQHPSLALDAGDNVIFSSRVVPGNEIAVGRVINQLSRQSVRVIGQSPARVHVSGHPARDELLRMYRLLRPRIAIPVHGELRHLLAHAELARDQGVPTTVVAENGNLVRIAPGTCQITEVFAVGRLSREGNRLVPLDGELVRGRTRAIYNGAALVTVAVGEEEPRLKQLQLSSIGLMELGEEGATEEVRRQVQDALGALTARDWAADDTVAETVRLATRRTFRQLFDKRPVVAVHVVRQGNHSRREP